VLKLDIFMLGNCSCHGFILVFRYLSEKRKTFMNGNEYYCVIRTEVGPDGCEDLAILSSRQGREEPDLFLFILSPIIREKP